jgi:hypothetical protein
MENGKQPAHPTSKIEQVKNGYGDVTGYKTTTMSNGLSKREYFTGLAMQGLLSNRAIIDSNSEQAVDYLVKLSVHVADALLKALEEPNN